MDKRTTKILDLNVFFCQTFSGVYNSNGSAGTPTLSLDCGFAAGRTMTLLSDSLTANLAWIEEMMVSGKK